MASQETVSATEEYLYLYSYIAKKLFYNWFGYFRNRQEAETTIMFYKASVPDIKTVSLNECKYGANWNGLHIPYKKSDWEKMRD